jgi:signal transduction histidine kinase
MNINVIDLFIANAHSLTAHIFMILGLSVPATLAWPSMLLAGLLVVCMCSLGVLAFNYRRYALQKKENAFLERQHLQLAAKMKRLQEFGQQTKSSQEKLKNINFTKDKFFSIIAHDLKGPLNSLTGLLQLLIKYADSFSKEELKDFGKNMSKSVNNLLDLLENLLHWSQSQSGMMEYCPEELNIQEIISKTVNLLSPSAENKNIRIDIQVNEGIVVFADRNMISFALRNLLSNAIKFTNKEGRVSVFSSFKEGLAEIAIADTGVGMSAEDVQKLFRIDKCYTTNGTANEIGTGLGLILCNEFIEKNKGSIQVESELGKGSVFRFYLPMVTANERIPVEDVY